MRFNVLKLTCAFRFNLEEHDRDLEKIRRAIRRPFYAGQHCARTVAFIVRTPETAAELMQRMAPSLPNDRMINAWCETASADVLPSLVRSIHLSPESGKPTENSGSFSSPKTCAMRSGGMLFE